ncbi:uncharacterized protein LOC133198680 [Saccostrea echinata]|uniref:uncharacterized protein LOC133198680 n=1 Tax=Saccostrea echinata TaxID=191078 RepID=UPI002A82429B|nr:uncharacterized protein LOC133198680 [Saccostrea echinata]
MYRNFFVSVFLIFLTILKTTQPFEIFDSYAVVVSDSPTSTCVQHNDIQSILLCFVRCIKSLSFFYMISYNTKDHRCMCCVNGSGTALISQDWTSFKPPQCPAGYSVFQYLDSEICVKYVNKGTTYPEAVISCKTDGGDLIRIDSEKKYDIFKRFSAPYATVDPIEVWVQGEKLNGEWRFHDLTPMPTICPLSESNHTVEIHLRAMSIYNFSCVDSYPGAKYHYVCEKHRLFYSRL